MDTSPFHADELTAQSLAHESAGRGAGIRPFMPDQHRDFFGLLSYLFVATADARGWPVATVLDGPAGFLHSPDPNTLRIGATFRVHDPAAAGATVGGSIGLLGMQLSTRRRNRANGRIADIDDKGVTVAVNQSFGNCPQYIQTRHDTRHDRDPTPVEAFDGLDDSARRMIGKADTFFVASRARADIGHAGGLDVSHRGGRPGFVEVSSNTLAIPDFPGNRFFNTLGNLLGDPRCGLLFIGDKSGEILQLQGKATIDWTDASPRIKGARRSWRVNVERGWRRRDFPFDWTFGEFAPTTLATGTWQAS